MSDDMGDMFREWGKAKAAKRASNRDASAQILRKNGVQFVSKNNGAHLIVEGHYDFWPGTGLWMSRGDKTKRRGVMKLIQRIKTK